VDDTWAAVLAGASPVDDYLALADALAGETNVSVWRRLLGGLDQIERMLDGSARRAHQARVGRLVGPALEQLEWTERPGDTDRERELRGVLIGALATTAGDSPARARVHDLFLSLLADPSSVEANVAAAVIRAAAAGADAGNGIVDTLIERYRQAGNPQEEQRFLFALAEVSDGEQFARALEFAASPDVRTQNGPYLLASCIMNRHNGAAAWQVVQERWEEFNERFPSNSIVRMLNGIRSIHDPDLAARVEGFLAEHPVPQGDKILQQHLERMRVTVALGQRVRTTVRPG
jgi:hypothetical protein